MEQQAEGSPSPAVSPGYQEGLLLMILEVPTPQTVEGRVASLACLAVERLASWQGSGVP